MALWSRILRSRVRLLRWPGRPAFLAAVGLAFAGLVAASAALILIDAHDLYPWGATPHVREESLAGPAQAQILNVVTNGDFDTLLIGASSAQQFEGPDFARYLSGTKKGYAIVYAGAEPGDQAIIMDRVVAAPGLKRVLLSYDLNYLGPADRIQQGFPLALYDDTPLNDLGAMGPVTWGLTWRLATGQRYWNNDWDMRALRRSWALRYARSQTPDSVAQARRVIAEQKPRLLAPTSLTCADIPANANIVRLAERLNRRGVRLDIVIPPYSYAAYSEFNHGQRNKRLHGQPALASFLQSRRCMIAAVAPYPNTRVFGFDLEADIVEDMGNYWDTTHLYGPAMGRRMLEAIDRGENVLTVQNFEPYAAEMRRRVAAWDYENSKVKP